MPQTIRRSLPLTPELRAADGDKPPKIVGYAAVFYDGTKETEFELWPDLRERILPGTFDRALREKQDVRGLFNHDPNHILGRTAAGTLKLEADKRGLRYEIDTPDTPDARALAEALRRGDISGSSFSFWPLDVKWIKEDGIDIRVISSVDLYDVGPVTFPAFEATEADLRQVRGELENLRKEAQDAQEAREAERARRMRHADAVDRLGRL